MKKMKGETLNITDENIKVIAEYFPEAMEEGKIKFDVLKELLGEFVDEANERYQFTWNGKSQALKLSQTPSTGTLLPCKEKSKDWDTTENLYIEGDNLEVLKLLQKSYYKKIKMIYIDPPYNTGNDFVYKDDFTDNLRNYKETTKQECKANPETQGKYHTNWLNMMYPRLKLAKNLLTEDGVIFISIDDNEHENLKKICDEIFGENNFVTNIIWQKKFSPQNDATYFSQMHDFILCYAKKKKDNKSDVGWSRNLLERDTMPDEYKNPDNDPRGPWSSGDFTAEGPTPNCVYEIVSPTGKKWMPPEGKRWVYNYENFLKLYEENRFWFGKNGNALPRIKRYWSEVQQGMVPNSIWLFDEVGHTQEGKQETNNLFGAAVFDYPKPIRLLERLLKIATNDEDIILDFFSGSASTAHSVMKLNSNKNGNRKFIMVQMPEKCNTKTEAYKAGYNNICDVGEERIRRAGNKIKEETNANIDYGFKVFKLDSSNLKLWNGEFTTEEEANNYFLEHLSPLVDGRTNEDLLYELLLKEGMPLTALVEEIKVGDKTIYSIDMGYLIICLEDKIDMNIVDEIGKRKPKSIIFRDSGFTDENAKTNTIQELKKYGIAEEVIKSI